MRRFLVPVLLFCLLPIGAQGVTGKKMTLAGLTQSADSVQIGRVVDLRTVMMDGEVWTLATVTVEQSVKGENKTMVRVRVPGGQQQVNGRTRITMIEGAPSLNINEKALFFLNAGDQDYYNFSGFNQGYWPIRLREGRETAIPADAEFSPGLPLEYVLEQVRETMKNERQRN